MTKFQFRIPPGGRIDYDYLEDIDEIYSNENITKFYPQKLID